MAKSQLAKAVIINIDAPLGIKSEVTCMFNPKEYTLSKSNNWSEKPNKGYDVGYMEFGGGSAKTLTLQLFFDTYDSYHLNVREPVIKDVRIYTNRLLNMMDINDRTINQKTRKGHPPRCRFIWGTFWSFKAVITSISQKFTLFAPDGTPLRAVLDVTFKQIANEKYPRQNPTSGGDPGERYRTIQEGETLPHIAYQEYGDSTVWRHLADTNDIANPRRLRPGQLLLITPLPL